MPVPNNTSNSSDTDTNNKMLSEVAIEVNNSRDHHQFQQQEEELPNTEGMSKNNDQKIEIHIISNDSETENDVNCDVTVDIKKSVSLDNSLNSSNSSSEEPNLNKSKIMDTSRHSWHLDSTLTHQINSTNGDLELASLFAVNSPLQMRAVSSPSLVENPELIKTDLLQKSLNKNVKVNNEVLAVKSNIERQNPNVSESVLQKFKKTLSQFKTTKQSNQTSALVTGVSEKNMTVENVEVQQNTNTKHRFGPLIWRSSKERRKVKTQRRDKCNSGDSGIQVELENEENLQDITVDNNITSTPTKNVSVRRANSAKVSNSSLLKHKLSLKRNKENIGNISSLSGKSLSQPSGLDCIVNDDIDLSDDTDSDSSHHQEENIQGPIFAEVLFSFRPGGPQELALEKGQLVEIVRREPGPWWFGHIKNDAILAKSESLEDDPNEFNGWFPKDFVKILPSYQKPKQIFIHANKTSPFVEHKPCRKDSDIRDCDIEIAHQIPSPQNCEMSTENCIKELLETEINYVKLLSSLCLGFIKTLKERDDIFTPESVSIIFSNLDKIWRFQQTFLDALRIAVPNNRIGEVFLEFQSAFMVYSTYCNSYPRALMELENYSANKDALQILESCRISQNLPELPLSAHLLAPIQRICRYPLHLSELVKNSQSRTEILPNLNLQNYSKTEVETIDCKEIFESALTAMKRVTEMVNEGKRHSEYLSRIQARFENFQGPSINVHSTRLFLQTDAIRMSPNLWNNTYTLFLFDRQLIYCKKDLLKRTNYIYKGRIFLDNCRILNLPDGKMFGVTLKNALRLYCDTRNKWFDFCFRSSSSKLRFLNTLSAERQFCGESLFVSELAGGSMDDDNLSDREYFPFVDDVNSNTDTDNIDVTDNSLSTTQSTLKESPNSKANKLFSETLPKKSRKLSKEAQMEFNTNSLGRRKLGNWFRKAKSTNSTPSQSPTHHPMALSLVAVNNSDSSSQSSPALSYQRTILGNNNNINKGKLKDSLMATS